MAERTSSIYKQQSYRWGSLCLFVAAVTVLGALAFEYMGGFKPCPLCLQQRYAYYVAIPVLFVALILLSAERRGWSVALFFLTSLLFLANSAFGVFHAGAEWGYWAPPASCAAVAPLDAAPGNLLSALAQVDIIDCGTPELVILGLSLAGWNAIISLCLCIGCLKAAFYAKDGA